MQHRTVEDEAGRYRHAIRKSHHLTPVLALVIASSLLLAASVAAHADSLARMVRLSNLSGNVQIQTGADLEFQQAYPNMPLIEGSQLKTGDDGRAEIQFEDGSVIRLTPNSALSLAQLRRDGSGTTVNDLEVLSGLAYFETTSDHHQQYTVRFGNMQFSPAKSTIVRVSLDANPGEVSVLHGSIHLEGASSYTVDVHENETISFDASDPSRYSVSQGVRGESWDEWNSDRDSALAAMASQETREARLNGGGAGWSDLDYYGNWYSVPGYGNVWSPNGAGPGWDPYGSGYWGYYPGPGYVWISGYPWGWLPYSCGNWNFIGGYGWGWSAGGCGGSNFWNFGNYYGSGGVVIVNSPSGYRVPQRPARPHPVAPGANLPGRSPNLIAVNRGIDATRLEPRPVGVNAPSRVAQVGGRPITALPKQFNAEPRGPAGLPVQGTVRTSTNTGGVNSHPVYVPIMRPNPGPASPGGNVYTPRVGNSNPGNGGQIRPSPGAGGGSQYHGGAPSAPSHMSSPAPSSGGSSHVNSAPSGGGPAPASGGAAHH
jgi:FecR protein/Family of unknown function (DUF6600)